MLAGETFVGRLKEQAALKRLLDEAASGDGAVAVLLGPAGVGKTMLSDQLGREAERSGFVVGRGANQESLNQAKAEFEGFHRQFPDGKGHRRTPRPEEIPARR